MSIHDGHRDRLRERFCKEGLDHFSEIQVLELLLFYCIPRRDTNIIAHHLLEKFGGLLQVLDASVEELQTVEGIGPSAAAFLHMLAEFRRYCDTKSFGNKPVLSTTEQCGEYLKTRFVGRQNETVFLLCLDAKCKMLCCKLIGEGSLNSAAVPVRRIVETAFAAKAAIVVLAHNHPSGLALPSGEDVHTTHRVAEALATVEIILADHIIVAEDDFVSLTQSGYYRPENGGLKY